jgi:hypothetical protein
MSTGRRQDFVSSDAVSATSSGPELDVDLAAEPIKTRVTPQRTCAI